MAHVAWRKLDGSGEVPCARSSHGASLLRLDSGELALVVFGGEAVPRQPIDSGVHVLRGIENGKQASWTVFSQGEDNEEWPVERLAHCQSAGDSVDVWVFGGRQGVEMGEKALNDLWRLDVRDMKWTEIVPKSVRETWPSPRSFHTSAFGNGAFYVFGGCGTHGRLGDLFRFDPKSEKWVQLPCPGISGRGGASLCVTESGNLILSCGFVGHETNDIMVLDTSSSNWTAVKPDLLSPRSVGVSFAWHDSLLIFGGEVEPSQAGHEGAGGFANDLICINSCGKQLHVESGSPVPGPRGWASGSCLGDLIILFGGLSGSDESPKRHDDVWLGEIRK